MSIKKHTYLYISHVYHIYIYLSTYTHIYIYKISTCPNCTHPSYFLGGVGRLTRLIKVSLCFFSSLGPVVFGESE